jgi:hypothetical protein
MNETLSVWSVEIIPRWWKRTLGPTNEVDLGVAALVICSDQEGGLAAARTGGALRRLEAVAPRELGQISGPVDTAGTKCRQARLKQVYRQSVFKGLATIQETEAVWIAFSQ